MHVSTVFLECGKFYVSTVFLVFLRVLCVLYMFLVFDEFYIIAVWPWQRVSCVCCMSSAHPCNPCVYSVFSVSINCFPVFGDHEFCMCVHCAGCLCWVSFVCPLHVLLVLGEFCVSMVLFVFGEFFVSTVFFVLIWQAVRVHCHSVVCVL